jgi:methionyl-tRNA formyltransferase
MRILYAGSPAPSAKVLDHLAQSETIEVVGVLTQPDKRRKRRSVKEGSAVANIAEKHKLTTLKPHKLDENFKESIKNIEFDVMIVSAYGKILPNWLLDKALIMPVNIHYSLLPKYRGASPIQTSILNGDKETGITFMKMSQNMDEGDIIERFPILIHDSWNKTDLENALSDKSVEKIIEVLNNIYTNNYSLEKQNHDKASYCFKVQKQDSVVDFNNSSFSILNKFRALNEWPGLSFIHKEISIKIHGLNVEPCDLNFIPGEIISFNKEGIHIKTIDSSIVITHLQFPNKKIISSQDAFNSYRGFF